MEAAGLGGVHVLRRVVAQRASAEADQAAGGVADREDQPVAEAVVGFAAPLGPRHQPDVEQVGHGDLRVERADEIPPAVGRVAQAVALGERRRDRRPEVALRLRRGAPAPRKKSAAASSTASRSRWASTRGGGRARRPAPAAARRNAARALHRGREVVARQLHVELDRVAALAAAEAVEEAAVGVEWNEGVFSLCSGQRAFHFRPTRVSLVWRRRCRGCPRPRARPARTAGRAGGWRAPSERRTGPPTLRQRRRLEWAGARPGRPGSVGSGRGQPETPRRSASWRAAARGPAASTPLARSSGRSRRTSALASAVRPTASRARVRLSSTE